VELGPTSGGFLGTVSGSDITLLLRQWRSGDQDAGERLTPLVYDQLRKIAESYLRRESASHSLQPTELVNELFVELLKLNRLTWKDRSHFFVFSAKLMRQILIGHARHTKAAKRGGELEHVPLNAELGWVGPPDDPETLDLASAIDELEQADEQKVRALEMRYFFGFTAEETAEVLGISKATVNREIRFTLGWLHQRLHPS
jgi:RNA polymerase sigma factor (TIGR02999 family)